MDVYLHVAFQAGWYMHDNGWCILPASSCRGQAISYAFVVVRKMEYCLDGNNASDHPE